MNKQLIKPKPLTKGDTIGLIAPSGVIKDLDALERAIKYIESKGYKVKTSKNIKNKKWYLAGDDNDRLEDLINFFKDKEVKAIFSARGGYGCTRLLEKIDYTIIKENPKIFLGYSDITALHCAFYKYSNLLTFHGPLSVSDLGCIDQSEFTLNNLWPILEGEKRAPLSIENTYKPICINPGEVKGELIGGNLTIICNLLSTKYSPDYSNKILFIEEIGENLYKIDRYLTQLKLSGILSNLKGVIFGEFTGIPNSDDNNINDLSVLTIIQDIMKDIKTPAFYGFSCGHSKNKVTIPFGIEAELNTYDGILQIVEPFLNYS